MKIRDDEFITACRLTYFSNLPDFDEKRPMPTASPPSTHPDHPRPSKPLQ